MLLFDDRSLDDWTQLSPEQKTTFFEQLWSMIAQRLSSSPAISSMLWVFMPYAKLISETVTDIRRHRAILRSAEVTGIDPSIIATVLLNEINNLNIADSLGGITRGIGQVNQFTAKKLLEAYPEFFIDFAGFETLSYSQIGEAMDNNENFAIRMTAVYLHNEEQFLLDIFENGYIDGNADTHFIPDALKSYRFMNLWLVSGYNPSWRTVFDSGSGWIDEPGSFVVRVPQSINDAYNRLWARFNSDNVYNLIRTGKIIDSVYGIDELQIETQLAELQSITDNGETF